MKVYKIQQMLMRQEAHDRQYHADIYYQSTPFKVKHFAIHLAKYFARHIQGRNPTPLMVNTLLITLSLANTLKCSVPDINLDKGLGHEDEIIDFNCFFAGIISDITKAVDSLDHLEDFNSRQALERSVCQLIYLVEYYIHTTKCTDFEQQVLAQYQLIADKRLA